MNQCSVTVVEWINLVGLYCLGRRLGDYTARLNGSRLHVAMATGHLTAPSLTGSSAGMDVDTGAAAGGFFTRVSNSA